jgi:hypothetical protein
MHPTPQAGRLSYAALFLVALATLMYEVLLTRIFSVTLFYHFAFVAVSVALFGMTLGAVIVYLSTGLFAPGSPGTQRQIAVSSLLFGVTVVLTFIGHLKAEYASLSNPKEASPWSLMGTYCLIAIPFVFSGISVCLALTRFPMQVSRLYAADLAGAALGCIVFVIALRLTDGPTAVLIVAVLAILAALCSALDGASRVLVSVTGLSLLSAGGLAGLNAYRVHRLDEDRVENIPHTAALALRGRYVSPPPPIRIEHAKGNKEWPALFEKWNSFSRIHVRREVPWMEDTAPSGWGMSPLYKDDPSVPKKTTRELFIGIDAGAGTYMTHFQPGNALELLAYAEDHDSQALYYHDQAFVARWQAKRESDPARRREYEEVAALNEQLNAEELERVADLRRQATREAVSAARQQAAFLKYDVTNFAHYLRPDSRVLVIGSGGGRDVLSALVFDQRHVTGIELNDAIIHAMKGVFGDFTGNLDRLPNVDIVHDEARSYITRSREKADIIQISLIDTWAATAAGAFVLSENSLYTVEAWKTFLGHLTDRGVLTVSRWYHPNRPGETLRILSLANQSLREMGAPDPRKHVIILRRTMKQMSNDLPDDVANTIVSRTPFTEADLDKLESEAKRLDFEVVLSPRHAARPDLAELAGATDVAAVAAKYPINLAPPTDDKPFFFNMTRMRDAFTPSKWQGQGHDINLKAVMVLAYLLLFVIALTAVLVVVPVLLKAERGAVKSNLSLSAFFICIGLAFILVEIAQMQRLIILLGHPTYSLSVVLFALLVSSGIGSYLTKSAKSITPRMIALLAILILTGLITRHEINRHVAFATPVRIAVALILLMPAGLFMGMCFPLGMKVAAGRNQDLTAWLWGINGAMSVVASVLSVVLAMSWGIAASYWTGVAFYGLALLAIARASGRTPSPSQP